MYGKINNIQEKKLIFLDSDGKCYSTANESVIANFEISEFRSMLHMLSLNPNLSREDFENALNDPIFRSVMAHLIQNNQKGYDEEEKRMRR